MISFPANLTLMKSSLVQLIPLSFPTLFSLLSLRWTQGQFLIHFYAFYDGSRKYLFFLQNQVAFVHLETIWCRKSVTQFFSKWRISESTSFIRSIWRPWNFCRREFQAKYIRDACENRSSSLAFIAPPYFPAHYPDWFHQRRQMGLTEQGQNKLWL